jgi:hypothetical protein
VLTIKKLLLPAICICLLAAFVAYAFLSSQSPLEDFPNGTVTSSPTVKPYSPTATTNPHTANPTVKPTSSGSSGTGGSSVTSSPSPPPTNTPDPDVPHETDHEKADDYQWNSSQVVDITLNGNSITTSSPDTSNIQGSKITILSAGTYRITGTLTDGQIVVDTQDKNTTRLILNNIDVTCSSIAPIYVANAKKTILILAEDTVNTVKDVNTGRTDEPNAAVFSTADFTIFGGGQLNVQGNNNDGIASKDGLIIKSGIITVNAADDGIRGKDYLIVKDGTLTLTTGGDGLKSDNTEDPSRGYIDIENGVLTITAGGDTIEAETDITINSGVLNLKSGGGSNSIISSTLSAKGIKAAVDVTINGGVFTIDSADDNIHSNKICTINQGSLSLSTADDAIHSDESIIINDGEISITKSYEGIESTEIVLNGGTIYITSSDDGINGAGGKDGSGFQPGRPGGPPGQWNFVPGDCHLYINGGYIVVTSTGDGIDINGPMEMTSGYVLVNGPTSNMEGSIDWEGSFKMTGGFLLTVGSSGMAMSTSETSTQCSVLINLRASRSAGTLIHFENSDGEEIITFKPTKRFQSITICSPLFTVDSEYRFYLGGSSTGTLVDGVYQEGKYEPSGNPTRTFTISNMVTKFSNV